MKRWSGICSAILALSLAGGLAAQELEKTEAAVVRGEAWLNAMQVAYRDAKALIDEVTVKTEFYAKQTRTGGTISTKMYRFAFSGQTDLLYEFEGGVVRIHNGTVHAQADHQPGRLLKVPQQGTLAESITSHLGGLPVAFQLLMHDGAPMSESLTALSQWILTDLKVVASGNTSTDTQTMEYQIKLEGKVGNGFPGSMEVTIAPTTNLPTAVVINTEDEEKRYVTRLAIQTTLVDQLPEDLVKTAVGERRVVGSVRDLVAPVKVGEAAPDFTLKDLSGNSVTLSSLKGKVVVLDFWATWCGPCKRGLPMLEELYKWGNEQDGAVEVFAVDILERGAPGRLGEVVSAYWKKNGFTMPALLATGTDVDKRWGISSIPDTAIVGKDGKVAWRHKGYSPENLKRWKEAIGKALAAEN